ncbi:MAG: bifunctional shikimate kinase/3-dehydroquinate synthase [Solirubrobacterales bacterium]
MAEVARPDAAGPSIVLIGFMAAGKSGAARALAARLGLEAADADELIEARLGEPIAAFFEREGEAEFRRREREAVLELLGPGGPGVVALGGGAVESEEVRAALGGHLCVWCEVDEETAWERASRDSERPLAADREQFARRFAARAPLYEGHARAILPANARDAAGEAAPWIAALRALPGMRMIWASSASGSYPALIGEGAAGALDAARATLPGALPERSFLIADPAPLAAFRGRLGEVAATIEVPGGEASKTMAEAERVLGELAAAGARRDDLVVALGGGVVGDLAGFCAATYQRGIPVVQVPTTLVAQVDSAYGGKTGVDLPGAKNYVGAYHQPLAVLTDPAALATLPPAEMAAGFVEVVKTALLAGGELWERVRKLEGLDPAALGDVIFACARTKIAVVAADERDSGRRATLNLGHTVGHAIEAAGGYERYRHGEAVGLGLLAALRLSGADGLRSEVAGLLTAHGLPTELDRAIELDDVIAAVSRDKKATGGGIGFVLLERPGEPRWGQSVEADRVRASVEELYG